VDFLYHDFRNAATILNSRHAWPELESVIHSITADDVVERQRQLAAVGAAPRGGQTAINRLFEERLIPLGWESQPKLFADKALEEWRMDFVKERIGVEVSFNHAEAIPWQFSRLNIAGESDRTRPESRIDVGIVICADLSLRRWSRMDGAVGTLTKFRAWLREMKPILPIPILLVGLTADGFVPTDVFGGTRRGTRKPAPELADTADSSDDQSQLFS
jgi:hypothetical protein